MLYTLLDDFKKSYELHGDALIIDNHKLKSGIYLKIDIENNSIQHLIVKKKEVESYDSDMYQWFRERDFYSDVISNAKVLDVPNKLIHSNNYLSFFFKADTSIKKMDKLRKSIDLYYNSILDATRSKKKTDKIIALKTEEILDNKLDVIKCKYYYEVVKNNISKYIEYAFEYLENDLGYIKIFFVTNSLEEYKMEGNRYFFRKIFNNNDYNLIVEEKLYGLSGANMGLNIKKPYLEHKTMRIKVPFRVTAENALMIHRFLLWWKTQGFGDKMITQGFDYKSSVDNTIHRGLNKILLKSGIDTDTIKIEDFDIVPKYDEVFKGVELSNILRVDKCSLCVAETRYGVMELINRFWFSENKMFFNFLNNEEPLKLRTRIMVESYYSNKRLFYNYLVKGIDDGMDQFVIKYGRSLVEEQYYEYGREKAIDAFHLYEVLLRTFTKEGNYLKRTLNELIGVMNAKTYDLEPYKGFDSIEEYSFFTGQLAYFLLSKSQKSGINHDAVRPFLSCQTVERLNKELGFWFEKYSHAIHMNSRKFNHYMSWALSYETSAKIDINIFLAGYLANNIFYMKEEK